MNEGKLRRWEAGREKEASSERGKGEEFKERHEIRQRTGEKGNREDVK